MIPGKRYKPEDFVQMAWRRKWFILLPFALVSLGTAAVVRYLPNKYRSETLILVVPQRVPESYVRPTVTTRIEDRLPSISNQILSRSRLERIIEEYNLYPEERKTALMEDIVERMRKQEIGVEIVKGDAFRVSYIADNPLTAMRVTERLASLFIEENLKDREMLAQGTSDFLQTQLEEAKRRLESQEQKLKEFRQRYSGQLPTQLDANMQSLGNAHMRVHELAESMNRDKDRRLVLERMIGDLNAPEPTPSGSAGGSSTDPASVAAGTAAQQLEALRNALSGMELRYKPDHPDVIRTKKLIRELEQKVEAEELQRPLSPGKAPLPNTPAAIAKRNQIRSIELELESLDRQLAHKEKEQARLMGVIASYQARVDAVPARESEWISLSRDYETLKAIYNSLLEKKEDSKVAENLERRQIGEQFKVLDPARMPGKPDSPNRAKLNLTGAAAGLGIGLFLAGLLEYRDSSLRTDDDVVTSLGLPVLAMVPVMTTTSEQRRIQRRKWIVSLAAAASVVLGVAALVWKFAL
jgi:polysaccharide chain length determinant protein (PEP-CTERM system associated)